MSRIDRALRIKEGAVDVGRSKDTVDHPDSAVALSLYSNEERESNHGRVPVNRHEPSGTIPRPTPVDGTARRVRRAEPKPDTAELSARLMTTTSSAVSVEQYRRLAAVLHEEQVQTQLKTVMITSALPGD